MPGDDLVPHPRLGYTRAITINVRVDAVWPWLAQIGQGRGGLYSFDGLENLVRCDIHSRDRIVEEHQHLGVGDLVRMGPDGFPCFRVPHLSAPTELVLVGADPQPPHEPATAGATLAWRPGNGPCTRSTAGVEKGCGSGSDSRILTGSRSCGMWSNPIGFVMEREMLRGLKGRAEGNNSEVGT